MSKHNNKIHAFKQVYANKRLDKQKTYENQSIAGLGEQNTPYDENNKPIDVLKKKKNDRQC